MDLIFKQHPIIIDYLRAIFNYFLNQKKLMHISNY